MVGTGGQTMMRFAHRTSWSDVKQSRPLLSVAHQRSEPPKQTGLTLQQVPIGAQEKSVCGDHEPSTRSPIQVSACTACFSRWGYAEGGACSGVDFTGVTDEFSTGLAFFALNRDAGTGHCWGDAPNGGACSGVDFTGLALNRDTATATDPPPQPPSRRPPR